METIELFKVMGKRVAKLPPAQQEEIVETMLGMLDATERMNRSSVAFADQQLGGGGGFNLSKSVSSFALMSNGHHQNGSLDRGSAMALTSSPSNLF